MALGKRIRGRISKSGFVCLARFKLTFPFPRRHFSLYIFFPFFFPPLFTLALNAQGGFSLFFFGGALSHPLDSLFLYFLFISRTREKNVFLAPRCHHCLINTSGKKESFNSLFPSLTPAFLSIRPSLSTTFYAVSLDPRICTLCYVRALHRQRQPP